MNELKLINGKMFMSSTEIAELTNKQKKTVHRDIKVMIEQLYNIDVKMGTDLYPFSESIAINRNSNGYIDEFLLDNEHTMTLISGYNVKLRMAVVKRWQELENKSNNINLPNFTNPAEAARAWAFEYEQKAQALEKLEVLQSEKQLLLSSKGSINFSNAAKILKMHKKDLIEWFQDHRWVCKKQEKNKSWVARQDKIDAGYLEQISIVKNGVHSIKTLVTPKGLAKLSEIFCLLK